MMDKDGRFLFVKGQLDFTVTLDYLYMPNQDQLLYLHQTLKKLNEFKTGFVTINWIKHIKHLKN